MKYFLSFLLIAFLSGCGYTANHTAKNIGNKVKKCYSSLCLSTSTTSITSNEETRQVSVFSSSVLERTADILTW